MEQSDTPVYPETPPATKSSPPPKIIHTLSPILPLIVLLLVALVVAVPVMIFNRPTPAVNLPTPAPTQNVQALKLTPTPAPLPSPKVERKKTSVDLGTITWLASPVKISDLKLLKQEDEYVYEGMGSISTSKAEYYHVANLSTGGQIIEIFTPESGPFSVSNIVSRIIQTPDKQYVVQKSDSDWRWPNSDLILVASVAYTQQEIPGLEIPEKISSGGTTLTSDPYGYLGEKFFQLASPTKLFDTPFGSVYQVRTKIFEMADMYDRKIYLLLKDGTVAEYFLDKKIFSDNRLPQVTWSDGRSSQPYEKIRIHTGGCGGGSSGDPVIVDNSKLLSGIKQVGVSKLGDPVYQHPDPSSDLVKLIYDQSYLLSGEKTMEIDEFATKPNHFLWKDPLGDWEFFISSTYVLQAECAKPVIYLYPTSTQSISVKVGAKIRQSDPLYPDGGWLVSADPSGQISYQGRTYPYLFWDGLGLGEYPDYHDRGVVVQKAQVEKTLTQQLFSQGLNDRETQDFLDFWLPHLPDSPYVRLTWLGTADMNQLAPLVVNPRPDTVIRVFLEFEGLDIPKNLIPQTFSSPPRKGFTLVEWGGLLNR